MNITKGFYKVDYNFLKTLCCVKNLAKNHLLAQELFFYQLLIIYLGTYFYPCITYGSKDHANL
jgi:hypothetical protein